MVSQTLTDASSCSARVTPSNPQDQPGRLLVGLLFTAGRRVLFRALTTFVIRCFAMHRSWPAHIILLILLAWLSAPPIPAQSRDNPQPRTDEVVRVNTELAQTDVLVLDKNGQFVVGLTREQLQFRVNGKPRTVSF